MSKEKQKSVTRQNIVTRISQDSELSAKDANVALDHIIEEITASLSKGQEVLISGFGRFTVQDKAARMGRNPRTNEAVPIEARRVMKFKPAEGFRANLNASMAKALTSE